MVQSPPCNARDTGFIPGQGTKIPHAANQLSLCATTRESVGHKEQSYVMQPKSWEVQLRPDAAK